MPNIYPNSQPQPYYGVNGKLTDDAKALPVPKKVFILDKSVLLYSPYAVFAFDEHTVTIPFNVIRDLDAIKKSQGESSRNAQEALSIIETLREKVCTQITFAASECERSELAKEAIKRMQIKGKNHNK